MEGEREGVSHEIGNGEWKFQTWLHEGMESQRRRLKGNSQNHCTFTPTCRPLGWQRQTVRTVHTHCFIPKATEQSAVCNKGLRLTVLTQLNPSSLSLLGFVDPSPIESAISVKSTHTCMWLRLLCRVGAVRIIPSIRESLWLLGELTLPANRGVITLSFLVQFTCLFLYNF